MPSLHLSSCGGTTYRLSSGLFMKQLILLQCLCLTRDVLSLLFLQIGIIGGSGLDDPDILEGRSERYVETPYGKPSDALIVGKIKGVDCVLLARHGRQHTIMPTNVNHRANIWALKEEGCTHLVVTTACGSLKEEIQPGDIVIIDQFIDRCFLTNLRQTFMFFLVSSEWSVNSTLSTIDFCLSSRVIVFRSGCKSIDIIIFLLLYVINFKNRNIGLTTWLIGYSKYTFIYFNGHYSTRYFFTKMVTCYDRLTTKRHQTFYDGSSTSPAGVCHIPMADPFCKKTREVLIEVARNLGVKCHPKGTMLTIEGPRFSSRAESLMFRQWGVDVLNMTTVPEVVLAREAGLCYASIAMATDYDCWKEHEETVCVDNVLKTMKENANKAASILLTAVPHISKMDWVETVKNMKVSVRSVSLQFELPPAL
ncbi:MTAP phosphorylase, partial [Polyodon spathula]|nr:MTAP phosphorylase [Polyodon spathula]